MGIHLLSLPFSLSHTHTLKGHSLKPREKEEEHIPQHPVAVMNGMGSDVLPLTSDGRSDILPISWITLPVFHEY